MAFTSLTQMEVAVLAILFVVLSPGITLNIPKVQQFTEDYMDNMETGTIALEPEDDAKYFTLAGMKERIITRPRSVVVHGIVFALVILGIQYYYDGKKGGAASGSPRRSSRKSA